MELDFEKFCVVDGSPTTVLRSSRRRSKVDKKTVKGYPECHKEELCSNEDFTDINFHRFRSVSCKTSSRALPLDFNEVRKRGSVYQSSKEVRFMRKTDPAESRKKIEVSHANANLLPFGIVESLCGSDEDNSQVDQKRSSVMSFNSDFSVATSSKAGKELHSQDHFDLSFCPVKIRSVPSDNSLENSIHSRSTDYAEAAQRPPVQDPMFKSKPVVVPVNDGNTMLERDLAMPLHKSLSAKLALPHSPSHSESDSSRANSPKTRFGPVRKVLDPFVKSKSLRSPLSSSVEPPRENISKHVGISQNKTFRKSLLHDFSNMRKRVESESWSSKESYPHLVRNTPAHLHGLLKLHRKQGLPSFEFSLKFPEDVLVAKTWKAENGLNWIYTFHSVHERRKSNASGWGSKDSLKVSSVLGQMQVSCYLCAEPKEFGAFDHSIVTEFVLYDIAQQRKSVSVRDNPCCPTDVSKESKVSNEHSLQGCHNSDEVLVKSKAQGHTKHDRESFHSDPSSFHPLAAAELNPHFQIGAVVVQVPYEKRESLKIKSGDKGIGRPLLNVLESSDVEERRERVSNCSRAAKVNVVVPSGSHGLPTTESQCSSPLLDRWRSGGGCDCGGWDMACPINIFSNPNVRISEDRLLIANHQPLELFVQGRRDNTPALNLKVLEDGQYAVDFHAQLSTLQAFSICVAALHAMESSVRVHPEQTEQLLQSNSLRMFIEEEVKSLMNAVTEEGKCKENKRMEAVLPSFLVNPPFSPISRV
ncbi:OLC1v1029719C1 [Oldenlandia corymbosa var. corymbosa]|uniref:OLC1v1029719C1 n=1 Tax=Oldenlandia corymbosa var. corymbosa TaxID=529605 RepID=A0AAV1CHF2_OLDCO|nr:OLC1v1029719C1 [Oldenlandia corymbosa var. corymbosa]